MDDRALLERLLAPVHDASRRTARRLSRSDADGDDLFHEALLRAWERLGELRDHSRFRAWFYAILLSVHRARHRRGFWRRLIPLDDVPPPVAPGASDAEDQPMRAARMARALQTLPAVAREAIVLFELEGFTLEEIAGLQKQSLSAIKSRLTRARERLRGYYRSVGIEPAPVLRRGTS